MNSCPTVNTYRSGVITFGVIGNAAYVVGVLSQGSCDQRLESLHKYLSFY